MDLLSPEPISHRFMVATVSKGMTIEVHDPVLDMRVPKQIVVTFFNEFRKGIDGKVSTVIPSSQLLRGVTEDEVKTFNVIQSLIGTCISNAEAINRRLYGLLRNILAKHKKSDEIEGMEFMQLRDKLSAILKHEKMLKEIDELSSGGKVKDFTKTFFRYITDRNIYTHGELSLDVMGGRLVIHAKVNGKESFYKIDRAILESHINYFKELTNVLAKLDVYFREKK